MGISPGALERWAVIRNTNDRYEVSNLGRVRNANTGQVLKPRPMPHGYLRVHIGFDGNVRKDAYIHRLVAEAFCERPEGADVINHIDNDPTNNRADNLEWTTQRSNVLYAMNQGRVHRFPNAKPVIGIKDGKVYNFRSAHEAAQEIKGDSKCISNCCRGIRKTHHGYSWQFAEVV